MNLLLDVSQIQALVAQHPRLAHLREALRLSHRIEVPSGQLDLAELHTLAALLVPVDASAPALSPVAQIRGLIAAREAGGPTFGKTDDLEQLLPALAAYLGEGAQRGWLFAMQAGGRPLPWVVTRRDIKGLAKLVAKYCQHKGEAPTPAVFERCAVFRGLDGLPTPVEQEA